MEPFDVLTEQFDNLDPGKRYLFKVYDENGDGLCCDHGMGTFTVTDNVGQRTLFGVTGRGFQDYLELDFEVLPDGKTHIAHKSGHYRPTSWQDLETQLGPESDSAWPGAMPSVPLFSLAINVDIDDNPQEVSWTLYRREDNRDWSCLLYTSPSPRDRG